jgi:hypothetical protein
MRAFALLLAVVLTVVVLACGYLAATALRRGGDRRSREKAVWRPRHYTDRGATVIAVSLTTPGGEVLDEHVVLRLPDQESDWQGRFLEARQEAEERAFHLNSGG